MTSYRQTGLMWLLFNILLFFTGFSGDTSVDAYSSVGDTARLPCSHSGSFECSSIMWGFNNQTSKSTIELVTDGKVKKEHEKEPGKLKVGSDCSLHINNLTTADTGHYFCRLYHNEEDYEDAPHICLSLLSISSSPPVTELKIGSTVSLHCQLHSHRPCRHSMRVTWVSETGNPLQGARYKVSETQCSSSLTLTLERSDRNMKWRCQLTEGEEQKASLSYTTSFPGAE
ncbi:uncharacterized protein LOC133121729 [Conger conger]|uniref:uncharacterized protein LOC133121729 n=1 Tax=Conger conger TaxID=82655 RepID=UPI002A59BC66|nr:uncharacterized protein LOC133121729 [Conger conger]